MHGFWNDSYKKETYITVLPFPLRAVFMMRFIYNGHAHQLQDSPGLQLLYKQKGNT